jgi:hypothetical protein
MSSSGTNTQLTVVFELSSLIFRLLEVWENILISPAYIAMFRPWIIVACVTTEVYNIIQLTGTAYNSSHWPATNLWTMTRHSSFAILQYGATKRKGTSNWYATHLLNRAQSYSPWGCIHSLANVPFCNRTEFCAYTEHYLFWQNIKNTT